MRAWSPERLRAFGTSRKDTAATRFGGALVFGGDTELAHWDGSHWTTHVNPLSWSPVGIAGGNGKVWAIDSSGGMVRLRP